MDLMSIGEFARLSRLSPKALRLYDELGLLPPARSIRTQVTAGMPPVSWTTPGSSRRCARSEYRWRRSG